MLFSTIQDLKHEIARLVSLLQNVRSLVRPQQLDCQPISLATVAAEVLTMETPHYTERGIRIEQVFPVDLCPVWADREKLKQVLLNLFKNAAEAMPAGGTLTVQGSKAGEQVCLQVIDTGIGIPAGIDIFALFTTTKPEGTGLGLAIVQQIVEAHEGTITYSSIPGKGTTFSLFLPTVPLEES